MWDRVPFCCATLVVVVAGLATTVFARTEHKRSNATPPNAGQEVTTNTPLKIFFSSYKSCSGVGCHDHKEPQVSSENPVVCRCNEVGEWKKDKHKDASKVLEEETAMQMGKLLGLKGSLLEEPSCVNCHGVNETDIKRMDIEITEDANDEARKQKRIDFRREEGVTCVLCHGPYENWVEAHRPITAPKRAEWRKQDRGKKQEEKGMKDLWDPVVRAEVCASCHIGNKSQGKFVTHEMYAAGHPRLPSFELATFGDQMPLHWQYVRDKDEKVQTILFKEFEPKLWRFEKTRTALIGGVVALRESAKLIADYAADDSQPALDFAHFDCMACHHDLKDDSWRQRRRSPGSPGRPTMSMWPLAIAGVVSDNVGTADRRQAVSTALQNLRDAVTANPFGHRPKIVAASRALHDNLEGLTRDAFDLDEQKVKSVLQQLCEIGNVDSPDYDTARQLAWVFKIAYLEWKGEAQGDKRVLDMLNGMDEKLKLSIPYGPGSRVVKHYGESLEKLNAYSPSSFQKNLKELSKLLSNEP